MNLLSQSSMSIHLFPLPAGVGPNAPAGVDTKGFGAILFLTLIGQVTGAGITEIKLQSSPQQLALPSTAWTDVPGGTLVSTPGKSFTYLAIDVIKPRVRYVRLVLTRSVANSVFDGTTAILYNPEVAPTIVDPDKLDKFAIVTL